MFSFLRRKLYSLRLHKSVGDDKEINRFYYNQYNHTKPIVHIHYNLRTGEIKNFHIQEGYRNKTLGSKILNEVLTEMKEHKCDRVYLISYGKHPFWNKHQFRTGLVWNDDNDTVLFYKPLCDTS
jgi:N-acetylglutamate synthase-like GNAT family acetyltransferase